MPDPRPYDERPKYQPNPEPVEKHPINIPCPPVDNPPGTGR
jgi:hypothetical protein